jgi:hypothetical protein
MPAKLDDMNEITPASAAYLSGRQAGRGSRDVAAWVGASVLGAFTLVALVPPALFAGLMLRHSSSDWPANQANQVSHAAAAGTALLIVLTPAVGAAVGGLATLPFGRRVSAAARATAMAGGAFLASLTLTVGGFLWIMGHAQFTL